MLLVTAAPVPEDRTTLIERKKKLLHHSTDLVNKHGDWKRSLAWRDKEFTRHSKIQPHSTRRQSMLEKYPQIRLLFRRDPIIFWVILLCAVNQTLLAYFFGKSSSGFLSSLVMVGVACVLGASICCLQSILIHECSHHLIFSGSLSNRMLMLLNNVGTIVPISMAFRRYHLEHHKFQGDLNKDPDLPLEWELRLIKGSFSHKLLWLTIYPAMYAFRAMARSGNMTGWEAINILFTFTCDFAIYYFFGVRAIAFLAISFFFGYTFHPVAAHFIQEHYTYIDGQETYNYYGWANSFFLNIGFHNEHHDFSAIPCRLLPLMTKVAPEYYLGLAAHMSWRNVLWTFIKDTNMGPQSRCVRE